MFNSKDMEGYIAVMPGITRKTLVYGITTLMAEFVLEENAILPEHSHQNEQTGYLVQGRMLLTIGEETYSVEPGDSWCIPGGVLHQARSLEKSLAIEVFSPLRDDYIPE